MQDHTSPKPQSAPRGHYRQEDGFRLIEVNLSSVPLLFSGLDPSPLRQKDLDPDTEEYILGAAREIGLEEDVKIVFHVPGQQLSDAEAVSLAEAVHNFFAYREWVEAQALRQLLRTGAVSLAIGLAFLFLCLLLRELVGDGEGGTARTILAEGLLIMGWVAMWRPIKLFLYDWWPILRQQRLFRRLRGVAVECRAHSGPKEPPVL